MLNGVARPHGHLVILPMQASTTQTTTLTPTELAPAKLRPADAARHFGISRTHLYTLAQRHPEIRPARVSPRVSLFDVAALTAFFDRLRDGGAK